MTSSPDVSGFVATGSSIDEQLETFELVVVEAKWVRLLAPSARPLVVLELMPKHHLTLVLADALALRNVLFRQKSLTQGGLNEGRNTFSLDRTSNLFQNESSKAPLLAT